MEKNLNMKNMKNNRKFVLFIVSVLLVISCQSRDLAVKTFIDVLKESGYACLQGKRVGLITNPTGVDKD